MQLKPRLSKFIDREPAFLWCNPWCLGLCLDYYAY